MEEIEKAEYPKLISKQKFLSGIKCDILFWNSLFGDESQSFSTKNESNYIRNNIQTETFIEIIKSFFKNHYEIPFAGSIQKAKLETEKSIPVQEVLLNGIFIKNSLFAKTDVLKKNEDGSWNLYEIKHSVSIKKDYYAGSFFQKKVLELSGLVIQKCFIIQPNDKYILDGEFDIEKFLLFTDITEKVNGGKKLFNETLDKLVHILETKTRPVLNTDNSCSTAKICTLKTCWKQPENMDIFQLRDGKELSNELYSKGIYFIKDIPLNLELTENQKIQIASSISQKEFINELKLKEFLSQLIYPLYFLDFETINPSTPIFPKTNAFLHVPFLYSLQIQKEETSNLETYSYIDDNSVDPREKILQDL